MAFMNSDRMIYEYNGFGYISKHLSFSSILVALCLLLFYLFYCHIVRL